MNDIIKKEIKGCPFTVKSLFRSTEATSSTSNKNETIDDIFNTDNMDNTDTEYASFINTNSTVKLIDSREIANDMKINLNLICSDTKQMNIEINNYRTYFKNKHSGTEPIDLQIKT